MERYYESFRIHLHAEYMGDDLCVTICGGDTPHIGSVAIAEPRDSLTGDGHSSATVSTFNFLGHKDSEVANAVAYAVSSQLKRRTVVLCGIHYNHVTANLLSQVDKLAENIVKDILIHSNNP